MYLHKVTLFDQKKEQATSKMKLENIMLNKRRLPLGRKVMTNLDSILKGREVLFELA